MLGRLKSQKRQKFIKAKFVIDNKIQKTEYEALKMIETKGIF